jgi:pilus assembly protein Flp/PilA
VGLNTASTLGDESMKKFFENFWSEDEGLTVVEYVIGAALLAVALGVVFTGWGNALQTKLNNALT